jgi:type III secretory pathway component EscV
MDNSTVAMKSNNNAIIKIVIAVIVVVLVLYLIAHHHQKCHEHENNHENKEHDNKVNTNQVMPVQANANAVQAMPSVQVQAMPTVPSHLSKAPVVNSTTVKVEGFNNDLPNPNVKLVDDEDDYSKAIQEMALDKSVLEQHNTYVNERNKVTSTASFQPSRSDAQDVVPFMGLRRPMYAVEGKDLVDESARNVPSQIDADQLAKPTQIYWK